MSDNRLQFDVFLAHNSKDKPEVIKIANKLRQGGLNPWLDKEQIFPGDNIQEVVFQGISQSKVGAFFISQNRLGAFQRNLELGAIIQFFLEKKEKGFRVIPILLPDISDIPDELYHLKQWAWIRFTNSNVEEDEEALQDLIRGIRGRNFKDEDIASIEKRILANKQVVYSPPSPNNTEPEPEKFLDIPVTSFKFETAKLKPGVLSLGKSSEITPIFKTAEYFAQDLGNGVNLEMVAIPGGTFIMGSPENEEGYSSYQSPQHQVTVPPFFMGKYPVTQKQWKAVAALEKVKINLQSDPSRFKGDNLPVECVSWNDAQEFCARLSRMGNKTYRLPSEAEWEYACRGGTTTPFYCGETISTDLANYAGYCTYGQGQKGQYREKTTEVGIFPANPFGLYDMCGNVWEWCKDGWHDHYINAPTDGSAWTSLSSQHKLLRGGSWYDSPAYCRSAYRYGSNLDNDYVNIGFRVVCSGAARTC
ncbi:SUMF1/EgtB/PvdO family nonheme iron enzyme [Dolichospermum sp. UHCC 0684]|uniref:SUMF1/EgtB/PvdO family nonheme iron enzyme n=1 Tax=unclassified Dolichospermum TaxID=2622029 RepID=UPI001447C500|nr:SUMF1/EgtB/PvdO family nonheme iron enzyme [Dolichospermum sp. UHCC 0684]MEA5528491.1 SUMF1/EgtB/PvdO family nonheme iron enzyme [Dolichospermum sp. UHCC 0684]MTJ33893.1 SUMF1/EgtB/PvdOfamily nonheme iron enzyme [Dolichospermum sp. UHCC 0260]